MKIFEKYYDETKDAREFFNKKFIKLKPKPNAKTKIFKVQPPNFILAYAVKYIEYTHQYSDMIKIQIDIIVAPNERNLMVQK